MPARTWFYPSTGWLPCQRVGGMHASTDARPHANCELNRDLVRRCSPRRRIAVPGRDNGIGASWRLPVPCTPDPLGRRWGLRLSGAGTSALYCTVRSALSCQNDNSGRRKPAVRRTMASASPVNAARMVLGRRTYRAADQQRCTARGRVLGRAIVPLGHGTPTPARCVHISPTTVAHASLASCGRTQPGDGTGKPASLFGRAGNGWIH
jgi:hypothetical protein